MDYTFNEPGDVTFKPGLQREFYSNGTPFLLCGGNNPPLIATTHVS